MTNDLLTCGKLKAEIKLTPTGSPSIELLERAELLGQRLALSFLLLQQALHPLHLALPLLGLLPSHHLLFGLGNEEPAAISGAAANRAKPTDRPTD